MAKRILILSVLLIAFVLIYFMRGEWDKTIIVEVTDPGLMKVPDSIVMQNDSAPYGGALNPISNTWCADTIYPAQRYLSWLDEYAMLDSVQKKLRMKDFILFLRERIYTIFPSGFCGVTPSTYYMPADYPHTCKRWYSAVAKDSIELVCGDFSNVQHLYLDLWNIRACNFSMSTLKFYSEGGGHVQTLVEVIDSLDGRLDTTYSVQDAMTNYTYVWADGRLMDIRDMIILLLSNQKDSIYASINNILSPNLTTDKCFTGRSFDGDKMLRLEHSQNRICPFKLFEVRSIGSYQPLFDRVASDWGYPEMEFFEAKEFAQSVLFIDRFLVTSVSSKHYAFWGKFFSDIDSLKLAYGFNSCAGIYPPDTIRTWASAKADIENKLNYKNSLQDSVITLLDFAKNVIRFGDMGSCVIDKGSHSAEEWFDLFEHDSVITNYSGAADFFGKLCEEFGFQTGKYYIGTPDLTTAVFTIIYDRNKQKYYLLDPTFGLYCTDMSGALIDIREYIREIKQTVAPSVKLSYIHYTEWWNNFSKSGYLTNNSCARILPNPFMRPRPAYMSWSHSTSAPYKLVGVRDIEHNFKFTKELWNQVKLYHNHKAWNIEFGNDLRSIPAYKTGMTGFPKLEVEIDRILALPWIQRF